MELGSYRGCCCLQPAKQSRAEVPQCWLDAAARHVWLVFIGLSMQQENIIALWLVAIANL